MMTITGTTGADDIDGSADPDEIHGLEGDDSLYGHGGNDSLYGDDGDDQLAGGAGDDVLDGGEGDDTLWGGEGADSVIFRDGYGHDVIMDFDVAGGLVYLNSAGVQDWTDVQDHLSDDHDGTAILILDDGSSLRFEGLTRAQLTQSHFILPPPPVCFAAGSLISTARGAVPVEALQPGDLLITLDHGLQPLLWIGRQLTVFGHGAHQHHPVRVAAGAMGGGLPTQDLLLSPQHRLLVRGPEGKRFVHGALAKAKGLCGRPGIAQDMGCTAVEYVQLLLPRHSIILANDLPCETFLPRSFALASLPPSAHANILALIPALAKDPERGYGHPARPLLSMKRMAGLSAIGALAPALIPICAVA